MEPIDVARQQLDQFLLDLTNYEHTITTEQDTRVKVIDRVLVNVLGWGYGDIQTEARAGNGFIDYKLTIDGYARLVIEAKRDSRGFGLSNRSPGRAYRLDGPVFTEAAAQEGIEQAIAYCGRKNAELACVTNGHEWVVFRGSRLGDGKDTREGMAFVFPNTKSLGDDFRLFFDLLSRDGVADVRYRAHFQEAEGKPIRSHEFRRALRSAESRLLIAQTLLTSDLDRIMTSFFRRLSGDEDQDLLARCFVVTRDSQRADEKLARISEDLVGRIKSIDSQSAEELTGVIDRVRKTHRNEFVLLIGTKGAGKSTFIDRFFRFVLPRPLASDCVVARINVADSDGEEGGIVEWLDRQIVRVLEKAVFGDTGPSFDEIQGMFFDEYRRRSTGTLRFLYERDKDEFKIDFGRFIEKRREEQPHEYIGRLIRHVGVVRRKVPCLILDNADHFTIEFQERVFQYARSIYESELCLVIMPITDRTSWQLSREGALRSFENESLFLPTPAPRVVLRKRVEFIEERLAEEKREPGRGYFLARGISLSLENLTAFTSALQGIFLRSGDVAFWIGNFANNDIRRCLDIARHLVTSPHINASELLKTYVAESSIYLPAWKTKRALIKGKYDIYPIEEHTFIRNVFAVDEDVETSPLLAIRILQALRDAQKSDAADPFLTVEQILEYARAMVFDPRSTSAILQRLLEHGLCLSYDPTVLDIANAKKLEISPSGYQHLRWGTRDPDFILAMMDVTPISDRIAFDRMAEIVKRPWRDSWHDRLDAFVDYLVLEDARYCRVPTHDAYRTQSRLPVLLRGVVAERVPTTAVGVIAHGGDE